MSSRGTGRAARGLSQSAVWLGASFAVHAVVLAGALARDAPSTAPGDTLYDIDLDAPPIGTMQGEVNGVGTPAEPPPKAAPPAHAPARLHNEPAEKAPRPTLPGDNPAGPQPVASNDKAAKDAEMREAVKRAMLAPADNATPAGANTAAPLGVPSGAAVGGTGKAGLSASYNRVLGGWFVAQLRCTALNGVPFEEMKAIHTGATVTLTPDRRVGSFSMGSSNNSVHEGCVQSLLQRLQASGATLPESPDGDPPPSSLNLNFTCRTKAQCS